MVKSGELDLSTPSGRMMARTFGVLARYESEHKSERIHRKIEEQVTNGTLGKGGGSRPFGYEADRVTIHESEAELIRDAAKRLLSGESVRQLAKEWGKTPHVVRRVMRSGRIAGLREHHGVVVHSASWPEIIDGETHERLRALLDDPARNKRGRGAGRKYLLAGLAECSLCHRKLISRPGQRRSEGVVARLPSMVCATGPATRGCGRIRIRAEWLEGAVSEAVLVALDDDALVRHVRARESTGRQRELLDLIEADEQALKDLAVDRYQRRIISEDEYLAARGPIVAQIEANRRVLTTLLGHSTLADVPRGEGALRVAWADWSLDRRRAVLDAVIERVIVKPGIRGRNTYTPEQLADRIEVVWRDGTTQ
jgi:site-specific DNA recombinase